MDPQMAAALLGGTAAPPSATGMLGQAPPQQYGGIGTAPLTGWATSLHQSKNVGNLFPHTNWEKFEREARPSQNVDASEWPWYHKPYNAWHQMGNAAIKYLQEKFYTDPEAIR